MPEWLQFLDIVVWPLVVIVAMYLLVSEEGRKLVKSILDRTRRVKALGVELELGGEDEARRLKVDLEKDFKSYRQEVAVEFDRRVKRFDVERLLATVAESIIEPAIAQDGENPYRCTVYVEDIVFEDVLYRLLDYYPGGNGKGNIYSVRFGIIGRSWRGELSEPPKKVPDDRVELIRTWGMTREEAASQDSRWYMTFLLGGGRESKPAAGMLYVEAEKEIPEGLMAELEAASSVQLLAEGVDLVMRSIREKGPYLELFDA